MREKKLYSTTVEIDMHVMAASEDEARSVATRSLCEEWENICRADFDVYLSGTNILPDWEDAVPYGSDCDDTVIRIVAGELEKRDAEKKRIAFDKKQIKLFAGQP